MKRSFFDIREGWFIATDPENAGKSLGYESKIAEGAVSAFVPSIIQQFFPNYHGTAFYWSRFTPELDRLPNERVHINFGGADHIAQVWLNSVYLGSYEGGETPFSFDVTSCLKIGEENLLTVRIINPCDREIDGVNLACIPHRNTVIYRRAGSNLNHGGLWYGVDLTVLPEVYISDEFLTGDIDTGEINIDLTAYSYLGCGTSADISVEVYECAKGDGALASVCKTKDINPGENSLNIKIAVPSYKLWSTDEPNLYRVSISVTTECGTHTVNKKFGFREFRIKDGFFYLNRKKIFLKSAHSGNAFHAGQMMPVRSDEATRDFVYAKASGFNMLRAIAGLFRPEQLDFADEIGLLIYEECFASWCLAHSEAECYLTEEEIARVNEKYPTLPILDIDKVLERWKSSTEKMIMRDRNHPSIVIWGLLNETKYNLIFTTARDFLPRARELDPTRVIILDAGRWDYDMTVGSASNPGGTEWEHTWGKDGHPELFNMDIKAKETGDNHYYARVPLSDSDIDFYRTVGKDMPHPVFLSEFGIGSLFNVIEERKYYSAYGERSDLEDCSWLDYQCRSFEKDFFAFGLDKLFAFPESFLKESQRLNANERKRIFDIVRSNPRIVGYSLTGLLDHGMCGEGLWSEARKWKPEMFDAVSDGYSNVRFSLFADTNVYSGEDITLEAVLVNEGILKSGRYNASFAVVSDEGVLFRFSKSFELSGDDFVTHIFKEKFPIRCKEGKYKFTASLKEADLAGSSTEFFVTEKEKLKVENCDIFALGIPETVTALLRSFGCSVKPFDQASGGTLIVGDISAEDIARSLEFAKAGGKVYFLWHTMLSDEEKLSAIRAAIPDISFLNYHDWLYHKEYVLFDKEIFAGFEGNVMPLTRFGAAFPYYAFSTEKVPDKIICPGFLTGYHGVKDSYAAFHAMAGFTYGEGEIVISTLQLLDKPDHPSVARIIGNIIKSIGK